MSGLSDKQGRIFSQTIFASYRMSKEDIPAMVGKGQAPMCEVIYGNELMMDGGQVCRKLSVQS